MPVKTKQSIIDAMIKSANNTRKVREAASAIKEARLSGEPIAIVPNINDLITSDMKH